MNRNDMHCVEMQHNIKVVIALAVLWELEFGWSNLPAGSSSGMYTNFIGVKLF